MVRDFVRCSGGSFGLILAPVMLLATANHAQAQCPADTIYCEGTVVSAAPAYSYTCYETCNSYSYSATAAYSWPAGYFAADVPLTCYSSSMSATLLANDEFFVIGPAPGELVHFTATLNAAVAACGYAGASVTIWVGSSPAAELGVGGTAPGGPCKSSSSTLSIAVDVAEGAPFRIKCVARGSGIETGRSSASGTLSFAGLPGGYSVRSCQGFRQDFVPVLPVTWGAIKIRYR